MKNVTINDNGSAYMIQVDGLITGYQTTLGDAWRHIVWMHRIATQSFTVGDKKVPVTDWIEGMKLAGYID
jgi:hypothetical protein